MRLVTPILVSCLACSATAAAAKPLTRMIDTPGATRAAAIDYALPMTEAELSLDLILRECGSAPRATPTLALVAAAVPDPGHWYHIDGHTLHSWRLKRDLDIALYDNGTIKTVNSTTSDRTASILGSIVKFVAALVVPLSGSRQLTNYRCNAETEAALNQVRQLERAIAVEQAAIAEQQQGRPVQTPAQTKASIEIIDALAGKIGNLRGGPLRLTLKRKLDLSKPTSTSNAGDDLQISWNHDQDKRALAKWFETVPPEVAAQNLAEIRRNPLFQGRTDDDLKAMLNAFPWFKLSYDVSPKRGATVAPPSGRAQCPNDSDCRRTIVFRKPVDAEIVVTTIGDDLEDESGNRRLSARASTPIAQWGSHAFLSLGAKVLTTRTVALGLDPFGRTTSFGWKSEAKGEVLAGALGTAAESVGSFRSALAEKTEVQANAELVTELETQKKLNALIACRETIAAGGFTCPGDE